MGLCSLLDGYPGLYVVGEAEDAASAISAARSLGPDLVVIDPVLAIGDAYDALRTIRAELPEARILVLAKKPMTWKSRLRPSGVARTASSSRQRARARC